MPARPHDEDLIPVPLFPTAGRGFGHGVRRFERDELPAGYDRTINMVVRRDVFAPAFAADVVGYISAVYFDGKTPPYLVPWEDSSDNPLVLFALSHSSIAFQNSAAVADTDATAAVYSSATFHDDGAGTAYFYAGTSTGSKRLNRRTKAGLWGEDGDVSAIYIVSAGGALWRTTNDYQVSKCAAALEPFTSANWGAEIQVGTGESIIRALGAIGAAPVVFKEDGIYTYNEADNRFANEYAVPRHPNNFRFVKPDGQGGLITAAYDGSLIRVQRFGAITVINPLFGKTMNRDTPHGPIIDAEMYKGRIYALMAPAYRLVKPTGMKVLKTTDNFSTFTDYSSNAIDNSFATTVDISSLDTLANGDALLVGFDDPVLALHLLMVAVNGNNGTLSLALSTGAGTWTAGIGTAPSGVGNAFDQTNVASANMTFGQTGLILLRPGVDISTWAKATYDGHSKYWIRLTANAALDAAVTIAEMAAVMKRTGPSFTTTNADNAEDWEASGMLSKILIGRYEEDQVIWDDVFTLYTSDGDGRIALCRIPTKGAIERSLAYIDRGGFSILPVPFLDDPAIALAPVLAGDGIGPTAAYNQKQCSPVFYPSSVMFEEMMELAYIECHGRNFTEETDGWQVAFRWDDTNEWIESDVYYQHSPLIAVRGDNFGSVLHVAVRLVDGSTSEIIGPSGWKVTAWVRPSSRVAWEEKPPARSTPEVA